MDRSSALPVVSCEGCGVCCFHMGYPAYILPRPAMSAAEIDSDPQLRERARRDPGYQQYLLNGHLGEPHWHRLPDDLKAQWQAHVDQYQRPDYDGTVENLDGPCIWLDLDTRRCKHHDFRPDVCRDFSTGSRACLDWRKHYHDRIN